MKGFFYKLTFTLVLALFSCYAGLSQSTADDNAPAAFDLDAITQEWNEWYTQPSSENTFIGDFMEEFQVPQSGQYGLNRMETWYWWASHHPSEVSEYVARRNEELGEEE